MKPQHNALPCKTVTPQDLNQQKLDLNESKHSRYVLAERHKASTWDKTSLGETLHGEPKEEKGAIEQGPPATWQLNRCLVGVGSRK